MLEELLRLESVDSSEVFGRFAAGISSDEFIRQVVVASFILGVIGWARNHDDTHPYYDQSTSEHRAWAIVAKLIHAIYRSTPQQQLDSCWERLVSEPAVTVARVFCDIRQAAIILSDYADVHTRLLASGRIHARRILAEALCEWEQVPAQDRKALQCREIVEYMISTLGDVGDRTTIPSLTRWVDDSVLGAKALTAIETIRSAGRKRRESMGGGSE
jgi:hypothetical protein